MTELHEMIGAQLRAQRKSRHYSIEELAFLVHMDPSHLGKVERGENNITLSTLDRVLRGLDIDPRRFFRFHAPPAAAAPGENALLAKAVALLPLLNENDLELVCSLLLRLAGAGAPKTGKRHGL